MLILAVKAIFDKRYHRRTLTCFDLDEGAELSSKSLSGRGERDGLFHVFRQ